MPDFLCWFLSSPGPLFALSASIPFVADPLFKLGDEAHGVPRCAFHWTCSNHSCRGLMGCKGKLMLADCTCYVDLSACTWMLGSSRGLQQHDGRENEERCCSIGPAYSVHSYPCHPFARKDRTYRYLFRPLPADSSVSSWTVG